jgi:hypothetical protein
MKIIEKTLRASELPVAWQHEGAFAPTDKVRVRIEPDDRELAEAANLAALMDIVGRRMQERGLTEKELDEILRDT